MKRLTLEIWILIVFIIGVAACAALFFPERYAMPVMGGLFGAAIGYYDIFMDDKKGAINSVGLLEANHPMMIYALLRILKGMAAALTVAALFGHKFDSFIWQQQIAIGVLAGYSHDTLSRLARFK